jgi:hypothetical protein
VSGCLRKINKSFDIITLLNKFSYAPGRLGGKLFCILRINFPPSRQGASGKSKDEVLFY